MARPWNVWDYHWKKRKGENKNPNTHITARLIFGSVALFTSPRIYPATAISVFLISPRSPRAGIHASKLGDWVSHFPRGDSESYFSAAHQSWASGWAKGNGIKSQLAGVKWAEIPDSASELGGGKRDDVIVATAPSSRSREKPRTGGLGTRALDDYAAKLGHFKGPGRGSRTWNLLKVNAITILKVARAHSQTHPRGVNFLFMLPRCVSWSLLISLSGERFRIRAQATSTIFQTPCIH